MINIATSSQTDGKQLTYRRFSELLTELENMGLVVSHTSSKGRHGYGTQYKLVVSPEIVGKVCGSPEWWSNITQMKTQHDRDQDSASIFRPKRDRKSPGSFLNNMVDDYLTSTKDDNWKRFVGTK